MNLQITLGKKIDGAFINNMNYPNKFPFDGYPSTSKFLLNKKKTNKLPKNMLVDRFWVY